MILRGAYVDEANDQLSVRLLPTALVEVVDRFAAALRDDDDFAGLLLRPQSVERDLAILGRLDLFDVDVTVPKPQPRRVVATYRLCSTCGALRSEIRSTRPTTCQTCYLEENR